MPYKDPQKRKEYYNKYCKTRYHNDPEYRAERLASHMKWRQANPNKARLKDRRGQLNKAGIGPEQYQAMWDAQNGLCAICKQPEIIIDRRTGKIKKLAIDHDHETGENRGLLCNACNIMLGCATDNSEILRAAAEYIIKYKDVS